MRFSETLRFNANPDWWVYYVPYDELKVRVEKLRLLHQAVISSASQHTARSHSTHHDHTESTDEEGDLEPQRKPRRTMRRSASRRVLADMRAYDRAAGYSAVLGGFPQVPPPEDAAQPLVRDGEDPLDRFEQQDAEFFDMLDRHAKTADELFQRLSEELKKMTLELAAEGEALIEIEERMNAAPGDIEAIPLLQAPPGSPTNIRSRAALQEELQHFRHKVVEHYRELGETVNFSTLNRSGIDKILKKHDKNTDRNRRTSYMALLYSESQFTDTSELELMQKQTERVYADVFKKGDVRTGKEELRDGLRDLIIWGRNTIWRDVLRTERKVSAIHTVRGGRNIDFNKASDLISFRPRSIPVLGALLAFFLVLCFPGLVTDLPVDGGVEYSEETLAAAHRCLALVAFVVILWAFEGVPLYVTSFMVLPGVILLRVFLDEDGVPLSPQKASETVFMRMSSPTLLLIICVYAMGAALSKFEIDKLIANRILVRIRKPHVLLAAVMFLAVFTSVFVSNVAAPVLLNSVMMPTIDAMRQSRSNRKYVRCLLLGIMIASNIGGFASPISSPQSAVALGLLVGDYKISFVKWLVAAIPQATAMVIVCFLVLCLMYKPQNYELPQLPSFSEKLRWPHWVTITSIVGTVFIWSDHGLQDFFGSAGVVALSSTRYTLGQESSRKRISTTSPGTWYTWWLVALFWVQLSSLASCSMWWRNDSPMQ
ncbi:unnamed protein product [Chondrus crispus]|uniref:SPX domain-containing protein n=1 Tax=Chondrus crispus TaxID=2769 RepID=R7QS20_CHOCR|nr:unnamed protein product [Chondrus crispus]CDF40508.1 unnamed protein product [Chondrus crispus]|eukprot:XP_005710802.1 unnamed protein product [Chondrus crispus]